MPSAAIEADEDWQEVALRAPLIACGAVPEGTATWIEHFVEDVLEAAWVGQSEPPDHSPVDQLCLMFGWFGQVARFLWAAAEHIEEDACQ